MNHKFSYLISLCFYVILHSFSLHAQDTVDFSFSIQSIPDTFYIGQSNQIEVQTTDPSGQGSSEQAYYHCLLADSANSGMFTILTDYFYHGNDSIKKNILHLNPENIKEGAYLLKIGFYGNENYLFDTNVSNNYVFKNVYFKKKPYEYPFKTINISPSDTLYNTQEIIIKDTVVIRHTSSHKQPFTFEYRYANGLENHASYEVLHDFVDSIDPFIDTLYVEFEVSIPNRIPRGKAYIVSYCEELEIQLSYQKVFGIQVNPDVDLNSLHLLADTFSTKGAIMFNYTINNKWPIPLEWNRIRAKLLKKDHYQKYSEISSNYISGNTAPPHSDTSFTQGIYLPAEPGDYYVLFTVFDYNKKIIDPDLSNDTIILPVTLINEEVDWEIISVNAPDTVSLGQQFNASMHVRHTTPYLIADKYNATINLSEDTVYQKFHDKLLDYVWAWNVDEYPKSEYDVHFKANAKAQEPGLKNIIFTIGRNNESVKEKNDKNNFYCTQVYFKPSAVNLKVLEHGHVPDTLHYRVDKPALSFQIENSRDLTVNRFEVAAFLSNDTLFSYDDHLIDYNVIDTMVGNSTSQQKLDFKWPNHIEPGPAYILFVADNEKEITENNESDNTVHVPVYIKNDDYTGKPDFHIFPSSSTPFQIPYPSKYKVKYPVIDYKIANHGDIGSALDGHIATYVSTDSIFNDNARITSYIGLGTTFIAPGDTIEMDAAIYRADNMVDSVQYYIFFHLDPNNNNSDKNYDNKLMGPVPVQFVDKDPAIYDAALADFHISDTIIQVGESFDVSATYKNTDTMTIDKFYMVYSAIVNDTLESAMKFNSRYNIFNQLKPDSTLQYNRTITIEQDVPPGEYYVCIYRDYSSKNPEYNTKNDVVFQKIHLIDTIGLGLPNLKAIEITGIDKYVSKNIVLNGKVKYTNNGKMDVEQFKQRFNMFYSYDTIFDFLDRKYSSYHLYNGVNAGDTLHLNIYNSVSQFGPDTNYIIFVLDIHDKVKESNETDNILVYPYIKKHVSLPELSSTDAPICDTGIIEIKAAPLDSNEKYVWSHLKRNENNIKKETTDTIVKFNIHNLNSSIIVYIDSAGYKSSTVSLDIHYEGTLAPVPVYRYDELIIAPQNRSFLYQWYKDSILVKEGNSPILQYRKDHGEGSYYAYYQFGSTCKGTLDFGNILFPEPVTAADIDHCGSKEVTFSANPVDKNEQYQWYSFDTTFLGSSISSDFTTDLTQSGTYYVAIDSSNGISELSPFEVTLHYKPIDSIIVTEDMFIIADSTYGLLIEWMINGTSVDSLTNQRAMPLSYRHQGDISVKVSSNHCSVVAESPVNGIADNIHKNTTALIYPNPAHNQLYIRFENMQLSSTIKIYDIAGQLLFERPSTGNLTIMDISELSNGMYFVLIKSETNQFIAPFIKQ